MKQNYNKAWPLAALFLGAMIISGCSQETPNEAASVNPQRESWDAIKQLPDWSGVWTLYRGRLSNGEQQPRDVMSLTSEYEDIRQTATREQWQSNQANCLPSGVTGVLQHGVLFEFLFTPGRVTILFNDGEIRRIHTDGREHRPLDEFQQSFMGDSIGHWEGDTLVVDTIGFPNAELWQNHGVKGTLDTHLVERIHLNADGQMQFDSLMTDPAVFVEPYSYTRLYAQSPLTIEELACNLNNRDTGTEIDLTPPPLD